MYRFVILFQEVVRMGDGCDMSFGTCVCKILRKISFCPLMSS